MKNSKVIGEFKMKALKIVIILLITVHFLMAFGKKPETPSLPQLLASPDTIRISEQELCLETHLWRDFMPISPPGGKSLQAVIKIVPVNNESIKTAINPDRIWVIWGEKIWTQKLEPSHRQRKTSELVSIERIGHDGPKWGPDISVTVVVRLKDQKGRFYYLRAVNQLIQRTD